MAYTLSNLKAPAKSRKTSKRLGRGSGSGKGNYSGKGIKGQRARSGGRKGLQRLGLKMIMQRIPKHRGFKSIYPKAIVVNVGMLELHVKAGAVITPALLVKMNLIQNTEGPVKILGEGEITKAIVVKGCQVSKVAKEKIEKAGGKIDNVVKKASK